MSAQCTSPKVGVGERGERGGGRGREEFDLL